MEDKRTLIVQIFTLILIIASWFVIPYITENKRKEAEIGIWRHTAMSAAHRNLANAINELHTYTTKLASKYGCKIEEVLGEMDEKEFDTANSYVLKTNLELSIMYMIMSDDKYKMIRNAIKPEQSINLIECRNNLLVAMRKSQFPDTNFAESEDIRSFGNLKKPSKKATK